MQYFKNVAVVNFTLFCQPINLAFYKNNNQGKQDIFTAIELFFVAKVGEMTKVLTIYFSKRAHCELVS